MATQDFEAMQICENGHIVAAAGGSPGEPRKEHCTECGSKVLIACPACQEPIRTTVHPLQRLSGVLGFGRSDRPRYCAKCGKPFPWQEQAVTFLKDIGREASLSKEELSLYDRAVEDVAQNNVKPCAPPPGHWQWL